jgi:hypothetical protein
MREWTEGVGGRRIPILELLPRLERDLEAYAEDVAIEGIAGRPYSQLREALCAVAPEKLKDAVQIHAARRWQAKVRLAEARIARVGWAEACHQTALEVLGYRPNRAPMLAVAEAWAWERWRAGEVDVDTVFAAQGEAWRTQGVRPLNQPKVRLAQYARWVASKPDWPEALQAWGAAWRSEGTAPQGLERPTRKALRLAKARKALAAEVCGGALGGSRLDTWVCDAALPLLAARVGAEGTQIYEQWWRAWFPGDAPAELLQLAREFYGANAGGDGLSQGDLQGLLGWLAALSQADGRGA